MSADRQKYLDRQRRYNASEKGRARHARYNDSQAGAARRWRYEDSERGAAMRSGYETFARWAVRRQRSRHPHEGLLVASRRTLELTRTKAGLVPDPEEAALSG